MDYLTGLKNSVTGAVPTNGASSWFSNPLSSAPAVDANGMPIKEDEKQLVQLGGRRRRKRQCGGSFHPYTPSSDLSSTASVFKGGRRKTYRKKSHRKSHKKSHRKSHKKSHRKSHKKSHRKSHRKRR